MRHSLAAFALFATSAAIAAPKAPMVTPLSVPPSPLGQAAFFGGAVIEIGGGGGSGASYSAKEGRLFTISDRGPVISCDEAVDLVRADEDDLCEGDKHAKIFVIPDYSPLIRSYEIGEDGLTEEYAIPLKGSGGVPIFGLPNPAPEGGSPETAYDSLGRRILPDPSAVDPESIARAPDRSMWVAEEYGPSLLHVALDGEILARFAPEGVAEALKGARYPVKAALPAFLSKRKNNRGFEGVAVSKDGKSVYFATQSPLEAPDEDASEGSRALRLFKFDVKSETVVGQWLYALDAVDSFAADKKKKGRPQSDVKLSEIVGLPDGRLLMMERVTKSARFYLIDPEASKPLPEAFAAAKGDVFIEAMDAAALKKAKLAPLPKTLALDLDGAQGVPAKVEAAALVGGDALLLMNDDDFGVNGDATQAVMVLLGDALEK